MLGTLSLPLSALELRDAVRSARRFDPARLDRVLRIDEDHGLVEVQANTPWASLAMRLPATFAALSEWAPATTVGADVAANAAGPDGHPVVRHVEALTLVTPDGELRKLSRLSSPELFCMAVGGQGIFGEAYSITLRLDSLLRSSSAPAREATLALPHGAQASCGFSLLVPPEAMEDFLARVRECCNEWHTTIHGVAVRRTLAESETFLPWARREYAVARLVLAERVSLGGCVRSTQLRRALIDLAIAHRGSFPIANTAAATREQVDACYPTTKGLLAEKRRLDPAEKLTNAWYVHYRSLYSREACDVRWSR